MLLWQENRKGYTQIHIIQSLKIEKELAAAPLPMHTPPA